MSMVRTGALLAVSVCALMAAGCQQSDVGRAGGVFRAAAPERPAGQERTRLAFFSQAAERLEVEDGTHMTAPASPAAATGPASEPGSATRPATPDQPAIQPHPAATRPAARPYTAPGAGVQGLSFLAATVALGSYPQATTAGRELSEAGVAPLQAVRGRTGLSAPPTMLAGSVISRPGLQEGPATGLAFASPFNTIFTARTNPMSGPGGRCNELARVGFFGGSPAACERHFRR